VHSFQTNTAIFCYLSYMMQQTNKIAIAITGASGSIYAQLLLQKLLAMPEQWQQLALVLTENAKTVWQTELGNDDYKNLPVTCYGLHDFSAPFASGSGQFNTLIIAPCSAGTLGRIAGGISNDLITRAADVILKERRKLICLLREAPYNLIHIRNMETVTLAGGIICPASPSFYSNPTTIEAAAATVVDRMIDLAGLDSKGYRWGHE
jgi:flavin prenyltransferase